MFREVQIPQSDKGGPIRRWFQGDHAELVLWEDDQGDILRFRLVSRGLSPEEAVSWAKDSGVNHGHVEPGTGNLLQGVTPRWVSDFSVPAPQFVAYFQGEKGSLPDELSEFVVDKLNCIKARS